MRADYQYRRSDSAFDSRLPTHDTKEKEEEISHGDDGVTGGSFAYKSRVELLSKLAFGSSRPQDILYRLLRLQPETTELEWTEERNQMKEKDLLAAATDQLQGLNSTFQATLHTW